MVNLGDRVRDPLTEVEGIAYCRHSYLQGCDRIGIQQPPIKRKENESLIPELYVVDEPQLILVKKGVIKCQEEVIKKTPGGPSGFESSHQK